MQTANNHQFQGAFVALVTPMREDGECDFTALQRLVDFHINHHTAGLVILGTTAEVCCLSNLEKQQIITCVIERAAGRIPIIVGVGGNHTASSCQTIKQLNNLAIDGFLCVTPYYNCPNQEGLYQHFSHLASAADKPIIVYNVPGRTGCDLLPETIAKLAKLPNIAALKETVSAERVAQVRQLNDQIRILGGNDETNLAMMQAGACGLISVTANITPALLQTMCCAVLAGKLKQAQDIHQRLLPLHQALAQQTNPIPVKWALYHIGKIGSGIRLPLTPLSKLYQGAIIDALNTITDGEQHATLC